MSRLECSAATLRMGIDVAPELMARSIRMYRPPLKEVLFNIWKDTNPEPNAGRCISMPAKPSELQCRGSCGGSGRMHDPLEMSLSSVRYQKIVLHCIRLPLISVTWTVQLKLFLYDLMLLHLSFQDRNVHL